MGPLNIRYSLLDFPLLDFPFLIPLVFVDYSLSRHRTARDLVYYTVYGRKGLSSTLSLKLLGSSGVETTLTDISACTGAVAGVLACPRLRSA